VKQEYSTAFPILTHLLLVMEADLPNSHVARFLNRFTSREQCVHFWKDIKTWYLPPYLQVRPWRVYHLLQETCSAFWLRPFA
jgi:hypothetical protein